MHYILDTKTFKQRLAVRGFKSLLDFAAKSGIHRNTLNQLLAGKNILGSSFQKVADALDLDPMELMTPAVEVPVDIEQIDELRPIIGRLLQQDQTKEMAVVLFGSRAQGRAHRYSDWDIGLLRHPSPLSGLEYLRLKGLVEDWSEDLVREIDVINLNQAPRWFLFEMSPPIFLGGNEAAYMYLKGLLDGIKKNKAA